jgi:hypothetical protein
VAPADWELAYIDSGNDNKSGCYIFTGESGNVQFNVSGFKQGTSESQIGVFAIWKGIENEAAEGEYINGENILFAAYDEEDDRLVAEVRTDEHGIAIFEGSKDVAIRIGRLYRVVEVMDDQQTPLYRWAKENKDGYIIVEAVKELPDIKDRYTLQPFFNDLARGAFKIQKLVENEDGYFVATDEVFTFKVYAAIDENGDPDKFVTSKETNSEGIAVFEGINIDIGKTYYIFEEMTQEQKERYYAEFEYIEVVAVDGLENAPTRSFANCLKDADIVIDGKSINWNNAIVSGGLVRFTASGIKFVHNDNYKAPEEFCDVVLGAEIDKVAIYTCMFEGLQEDKEYHVAVALRQADDSWTVYYGKIPVYNNGGHDKTKSYLLDPIDTDDAVALIQAW